MISLTELHTIRGAYFKLHAVIFKESTEEQRETAVKATAARAYEECFPPHKFDPLDMLVTYECTDENNVMTYRVQWDPPYRDAELLGGSRDGSVLHLTFPQNTVTTPAGVGGSNHYHLVGFNTETRRHIFALEREGSPAQ